ncbi:MAG: mandelate racemase/muconate lactonizing enzyme family protein [Verrucomicrobia bacterium]|nr:mandelate racemase/muconate lactonizing enzyme family protein [Verrucomicrobiota bacterium]
MKIENIETFIIESPIDEPFGWSMGWTNRRGGLVTKITTDDGIVGWGEGGGHPSASVIHDYFSHALIGEDPRNINKLWHKMFYMLHNNNATGGFGGDAISNIDIALWDIAGKASGRSISELLGGSVRDKVSVYATGLYYREDEFPTKLIAEAESYVEAGYKGMKTKVGGLSVPDDVKRVKAIRDAIGDDIYLMVDANKAYNAYTAIDIGNRLADLNIHWFEEPVLANDVEAYLEVKAGQPIPVAGGEVLRGRFENRDVLARRALDIIQPDVNLVGGISEFRNIATMANAMGIQVNPHLWGSPIMISATISLTSTLAPCPYSHTPRPYEQEPVMEFDQTPNPIRNELASEAFEQRGGFVEVPKGPGLGIEIDESVLKRFCVRHCTSK